MPLTKISQVISKLDYIIEWSKDHDSPLGYFPTLYQRTTIEVERAINNGFFDHPDFMRKLDIRFAEFYLRAFEEYMRRDPYISASWLYTFKAAQNEKLLVLQHLLMGMNVHINLDLGLAVAEMTTPETIAQYKHDFFRINQILYSLIDQMQDKISYIWGIFRFVDLALGRLDEKMIEWLLRYFRNQAWEFANDLVGMSSKKKQWLKMEKQDAKVKRMAKRIGFPVATRFNPFYHGIIRREEVHTRKIIELMHDAEIYSNW